MTEEALENVVSNVEDETQLMLTTLDNPHHPKEDYDAWRQWDKDNGYHTEDYIARLLVMEKDFEVDNDFMLMLLTSKVINDILENDDQELYQLV